jgi:hypothetical protein
MGRSKNNAEVRSRKRLRSRDDREHEYAARRQFRSNPVVRERENVARAEHRSNPVVREQENAARQHHREEQNEIGKGAITDKDMSMEEFIDRVRNDENGECFSLADKNVTNALALWYVNMGYHRYGQHLKLQDPPPTLDQVVKQIIPDLDDALLTSKNVKKLYRRRPPSTFIPILIG